MTDQALSKQSTLRDIFSFFGTILAPENKFYWLTLIYGIGISLLSLATPISVQMLINTVANTGLTTPLVVLSLTLFGLLLLSGFLNAMRIHIMDLFGRRFYARMVSEIALRSIYALNPFFADRNYGTLFNRYFDIVIVLKTVPSMLVSGFTIVLQAGVGFILVSAYHPLFLAFNLTIVLLIWLIWLVWGGRAIKSAVEVSHKKHATAAWLEGLGGSNGFFKSERHIAEALQRTDAVTANYIDKHKLHFRHHFAQTICFLILYAAASAALLGLGGWLVIRGELSLGQLVAAELVLSVAFFGVSQLGIYLSYFYELCAALDEISLFYDVVQEKPTGNREVPEGDARLQVVDARGDARGVDVTINLDIPSGTRVLATAQTHGVQRELTDFLKRHAAPKGGYVALGGVEIMSIKAHALRQQIIVLDRPNAIEMTIREYLSLSAPKDRATNVLEVLSAVGLEPTIRLLDQGLETHIASTGWPLSIAETMQLKLAAAILAQPKVLILGKLLDVMDDHSLRASLDLLQANGETTVICFSNRFRKLNADKFLFLGNERQILFDQYEDAEAEMQRVTAAETQLTDTSISA